jgi:hypothetical protein
MADEDPATRADVQAVLEKLGPDAAAAGWTEQAIADWLDEGEHPASIARRYWEGRMARTSTLTDVTESGSSRSLSKLFTNAQAMAAYFKGAEAGEDPANQPGARTRPIRRV